MSSDSTVFSSCTPAKWSRSCEGGLWCCAMRDLCYCYLTWCYLTQVLNEAESLSNQTWEQGKQEGESLTLALGSGHSSDGLGTGKTKPLTKYCNTIAQPTLSRRSGRKLSKCSQVKEKVEGKSKALLNHRNQFNFLSPMERLKKITAT